SSVFILMKIREKPEFGTCETDADCKLVRCVGAYCDNGKCVCPMEGEQLLDKKKDILVIAGIPQEKSQRFNIPKPTWKEVELSLPKLKDTGVNAIFIWAPYEHTVPGEGSPDTITALTENGEIQLDVTHSKHITNYLIPDPDRGSEQEFLHMVETAHSLDMKVIAQLQVTVTNPGNFIYDNHPEWILESIYGKPAIFWPWDISGYGYVVNKAHPGLINYVTETIIPHWIEQWGVDGIYIDSAGMAYCDLRIRELTDIHGAIEGYECLTPVDGYYSPEPLIVAMKTKIEQMENEVGRDITFSGEMSYKTARDIPESDIIKALKGKASLMQFIMGNPAVDRTLGKYHDFVLNYQFRKILKLTEESIAFDYSEDYNDYFELERQLDAKHTKTARFVNMWVESLTFIDLLKPKVAGNYITLTVTAPGNILWIGTYQLPPQQEVSEKIFGWDGDVLEEWYKKTIKIKKEHTSLQSDNIENALISPKTKGLIAYNRWDEKESATVVVNVNDKPITSILNTLFEDNAVIKDELSGETFMVADPNNFQISVPAYGSRILILSKKGVD
ncbi:MAG: hypothetical protein U9P70_04180, partial [Patescibacteria group bacterium]|nr:hypothetical protein [Patescibacteria group bacterium]